MEFIYDKSGKLIKFTEFDKKGNLLNKYVLKGRELSRISNNLFRDDKGKKLVQERAKILYKDDCYLHHIHMDGENHIQVFKDGTHETARQESSIYKKNNLFEYYTVNRNILEEWAGKLDKRVSRKFVL